MKKPFKKTKIGKILTNPTVKAGIKLIPFGIGSAAGHILDEKLGSVEDGRITTVSSAGSFDEDNTLQDVIKLGFYIALAVMVLLGWIEQDKAESAKGLVSP